MKKVLLCLILFLKVPALCGSVQMFDNMSASAALCMSSLCVLTRCKPVVEEHATTCCIGVHGCCAGCLVSFSQLCLLAVILTKTDV